MRITEKELQRFVQRLRQEEKSGATVEKYCREAARFACWLDGRDAVKDLALAYKAVLVRERAPAGVNACPEREGYLLCAGRSQDEPGGRTRLQVGNGEKSP